MYVNFRKFLKCFVNHENQAKFTENKAIIFDFLHFVNRCLTILFTTTNIILFTFLHFCPVFYMNVASFHPSSEYPPFSGCKKSDKKIPGFAGGETGNRKGIFQLLAALLAATLAAMAAQVALCWAMMRAKVLLIAADCMVSCPPR